MFPNQITDVALVAIKNGEFKTLNYLLSQLWGWMESPDKDTASTCIAIAGALEKKGGIVYLKTIRDLYAYALHTIEYFKGQTVSA